VRIKNPKKFLTFFNILLFIGFCIIPSINSIKINKNKDLQILYTEGPLGEWPEFIPIGFITAPHPDNPNYQTHLYGDWGGIVGEEFIFLQDDLIKLLYHSYHETYMTDHPHQEDIINDWTLGYNPNTKIKYTPLAKPGGPYPGPAWEHTDTPGYIQHPITGEHLIYNTVRPGTKHLHPEWEGLPGWEGSIQVATSNSPPTIGTPFEQDYDNILVAEYWWEKGWNQNGVIKGGLSEPTPVWIPHLGDSGMVRLFYRGLHGAPSAYWNWRISYADSEDGKTDWIKNPTPTRDELLAVKGIGSETADSILLYLLNKPEFVIDAYTIRICNRLGMSSSTNKDYWKQFFQKNLENDIHVFNEFHALFVIHGKRFCKKSNPSCLSCFLREQCDYGMKK